MIIKKFKNGNFNIKAEGDERKCNIVNVLVESIETDFDICSQEYIGGSYYYIVANYNTMMFYNIMESDIEKWKKNEWIKLIGYKNKERWKLM